MAALDQDCLPQSIQRSPALPINDSHSPSLSPQSNTQSTTSHSASPENPPPHPPPRQRSHSIASSIRTITPLTRHRKSVTKPRNPQTMLRQAPNRSRADSGVAPHQMSEARRSTFLKDFGAERMSSLTIIRQGMHRGLLDLPPQRPQPSAAAPAAAAEQEQQTLANLETVLGAAANALCEWRVLSFYAEFFGATDPTRGHIPPQQAGPGQARKLRELLCLADVDHLLRRIRWPLVWKTLQREMEVMAPPESDNDNNNNKKHALKIVRDVSAKNNIPLRQLLRAIEAYAFYVQHNKRRTLDAEYLVEGAEWECLGRIILADEEAFRGDAGGRYDGPIGRAFAREVFDAVGACRGRYFEVLWEGERDGRVRFLPRQKWRAQKQLQQQQQLETKKERWWGILTGGRWAQIGARPRGDVDRVTAEVAAADTRDSGYYSARGSIQKEEGEDEGAAASSSGSGRMKKAGKRNLLARVLDRFARRGRKSKKSGQHEDDSERQGGQKNAVMQNTSCPQPLSDATSTLPAASSSSPQGQDSLPQACRPSTITERAPGCSVSGCPPPPPPPSAPRQIPSPSPSPSSSPPLLLLPPRRRRPDLPRILQAGVRPDPEEHITTTTTAIVLPPRHPLHRPMLTPTPLRPHHSSASSTSATTATGQSAADLLPTGYSAAMIDRYPRIGGSRAVKARRRVKKQHEEQQQHQPQQQPPAKRSDYLPTPVAAESRFHEDLP